MNGVKVYNLKYKILGMKKRIEIYQLKYNGKIKKPQNKI